ncbi:MAG: AraC family ligand binding domain-containing protein [Oligoflexia bacterium]|nr:AraC family ligand binding domain-containing protein [Oligoflexia bacterium]
MRQFQTFSSFDPTTLAIVDGSGTSQFEIWNGEYCNDESEARTSFGYVGKGGVELRTPQGKFNLREGMYFGAPSQFSLHGTAGILFTKKGFTGVLTIAGPVEELGRLKYIDGCSDSVLIQPLVKGDPCFNFLSLPQGIDQTAHTHPTVRLGQIISGEGYCETSSGQFPLRPGVSFVLPPDEIHSFHTPASSLRLVVFHPDTDTGPSHDDHPMLNRTIVNGKSAATLDEIRTR